MTRSLRAPSSGPSGYLLPVKGLLRNWREWRCGGVWPCCLAQFGCRGGFEGVGVALQVDAGRTYPMMAAHRRMLKAIAAIVTWAAALASPT